MNSFSPSDLGRLKGKQQAAVEKLFIELREPDHVASELHVNAAALDNIVSRARRKLFTAGIALPDRRFAVNVSGEHGYVY